ncbi:uncharacterized protein LOC115220613 [Octopus sinensis]|uniref:Uncharacterized protein LOC115220613 n=1 Tax=Octopus sinensis TaxID=2607531 RepID=A0A6P7T8B7_9MOLL|nr:uncharacterized protein LOC115220613 [Octopus sinensis]
MKLMKYLTFSLSLMILIVNSNPTHEDEERLKKTLLLNYTKDIRPVTNLSTPVEIDASLMLHTLYDLDFVNNLLIARYLFIPSWTDEYLTWDPLEYNNISHMYIPKNKIWTPSLMMCNSVNEEDNSDINREVIVHSNGTVELWSLKYMETYCLVNAYTYPFDDHECKIDICVALHVPDETRLNYVYYSSMNDLENYKWDIHFYGKASVTNDGISQAFVAVQLRRKITIGIVAMLIPTVMMTILTLFVFLLPPESGEKVSLAMTIFLSNVLYLVQIDKNTPKNSKYPSLFILYLMLLSMLSGIVTLGSVVISKLHVNQSSQENKNKTQNNKVADASLISTVKSQTLNDNELQSKIKRNCISDHDKIDAIRDIPPASLTKLREFARLTSIILTVKSLPTHEDEIRLKDNLLLNYRKDIRPVINLITSVDIYTDLDLHTLYDLDFVNNILMARYMIAPYWIDAYLIWKPSDYNNITEINLPRHEIWTPSLIMCNSVNEPDDANTDQEVKIYHDGTVEMWSLKYVETYCQVNAYTYPFDEHRCEIHMCVAVHSIRQTRIQTMYYKNLNVTENYKWDVNMFGVVSAENDEGSQAAAVMYLRRKPTIGIIAMLIPTVMMTILTIFVFVLPPESGEKVSLATTIFLSNVLYLVEIDKNTPKNSRYPSLLMLYLMLLSMLSGIVTLGSVVISKLYINRSSREKKSVSTDLNKNKSQSKNVADISMISMVKSESLIAEELQSKKKRNCISDYKMKLMKYLAFSLSLMIFIVNSNPTHEDEERLKNTLLLNYRKDIRPVTNLSTPVEIDADLILHTLYDLDFVNNLLIARYLFIPWWTDEYLTWDPLEYNNISHMYIPKHQIWTPSLMMCNSVNEEDNSDINREVIVYSDGTVELWSLKYMETYCLVNAYTYPFDDHECEIDICVALHVPKETRLKNIFYGNMNITESYKWDIHFKGTANVTNDGISHTSVVMQLRRKITIGIVAMLIPTVMMTMLTLFVFLLPPESGEKVSLAMTIFLLNVLYLVQIDKNTPKNSKYPSLFLLYLMLLSMFSGIVTLGSVVISKLYINQQS